VVLSPEETDRRARYRRSILDFVTSDTKKLQSSLGPTDNRKLDEYLSSIREVERQLVKAESESVVINPGMDKPYGVPPDFAEHFKLMSDMMTIAFQADLTRVMTFLMTREGTSRSYREIGIPDGHHPCTHHQGDPEKIEKTTKINTFHVKQLSYYLDKLRSTPDGDGSLLDHSLIMYGAALSDANLHLYTDLPILLVGGGVNGIKGGVHVRFPKRTPLTSLLLTMLDKANVPNIEKLGDSKGRLSI